MKSIEKEVIFNALFVWGVFFGLVSLTALALVWTVSGCAHQEFLQLPVAALYI